jgi:hypothetical protein
MSSGRSESVRSDVTVYDYLPHAKARGNRLYKALRGRAASTGCRQSVLTGTLGASARFFSASANAQTKAASATAGNPLSQVDRDFVQAA